MQIKMLPEYALFALLLKWQFRQIVGMQEQVRIGLVSQMALGEKVKVRLRYAIKFATVTVERRLATTLPPQLEPLWVPAGHQEHGFMVAQQRNKLTFALQAQ